MTKIFYYLLTNVLILSSFSCQSQGNKEAKELAKEIESTIAATAGTVKSSPQGYYMKAKINGKEWIATNVLNYDDIVYAHRIYAEKGKTFIGFPFDERWDRVGKKRTFEEGSVADLSYTLGDNSTWGGNKGEMEVTKADDKVIEGKFYFTATSSNSSKVIEVTEGYFRIPREVKK
ncbi:MAG: hypothetical protein WKF87_19515 [Chryseolinea sp.]